MRRTIAGVIATLLLASFAAPGALAAPGPSPADEAGNAAARVPKVVVIVGPAGSATSRYRTEARAAADLARRYTPDVTEIYSPNATWPAVAHALQGASLVIYMGHGNGWPSRYRDELYPATQNGFGLNPGPDGDDHTHQYFGEAKVAADIRLARDAVVLLHHLCYASGLSEPGLPEGTLAEARQRVDNFAAGFIAAGASAVIAEAYTNPNHMLRTVLGGARSIESAWRHAPSANGNVVAFESRRSPGYIAQMDPAHARSGFERSIVLKAGLAPTDVRRGARGSSASEAPSIAALTPSLARIGLGVSRTALKGGTLAGSTLRYKFLYEVPRGADVPKEVQASARWDPLDPIAPQPGASPSPTPVPPPDLDLVVPERLGDVVAPVSVKVARTAMAFDLAAPTAPGRYRLTVTLHDAGGVAYDAATQALLPVLIVRVTGDVDGQVVAPESTEVVAGARAELSVWVANLGREAWGRAEIRSRDKVAPAEPAVLVGRWVGLGDASGGATAPTGAADPVELPAPLEPRAAVPAYLAVVAPTAPGDYLLLLDVVTPEHGSLVAQGIDPTVVRVRVIAPPPGELE